MNKVLLAILGLSLFGGIHQPRNETFVNQLTDFDSALCITDEFLFDIGSAWNCFTFGFGLEKSGTTIRIDEDAAFTWTAKQIFNAADVSIQTKELGIGTPTVPHGPIGVGLLSIDGLDGNAAGPHVQFTTVADNAPLMQLFNWKHDNTGLLFDGYWAGFSYKMGDTDGGTAFAIRKNIDKLLINYISADPNRNQADQNIVWLNAIVIDNAGLVDIVQKIEIGGTAYNDLDGDGLRATLNSLETASEELDFLKQQITDPVNNGALVIDTDGDNSTIKTDVLEYRANGQTFMLPGIDSYPTAADQIQKYDAALNKMVWSKDLNTDTLFNFGNTLFVSVSGSDAPLDPNGNPTDCGTGSQPCATFNQCVTNHDTCVSAAGCICKGGPGTFIEPSFNWGGSRCTGVTGAGNPDGTACHLRCKASNIECASDRDCYAAFGDCTVGDERCKVDGDCTSGTCTLDTCEEVIDVCGVGGLCKPKHDISFIGDGRFTTSLRMSSSTEDGYALDLSNSRRNRLINMGVSAFISNATRTRGVIGGRNVQGFIAHEANCSAFYGTSGNLASDRIDRGNCVHWGPGSTTNFWTNGQLFNDSEYNMSALWMVDLGGAGISGSDTNVGGTVGCMTGLCTTAGAACTISTQCAASEMCHDGNCREMCSAHGGGETCTSGTCRAVECFTSDILHIDTVFQTSGTGGAYWPFDHTDPNKDNVAAGLANVVGIGGDLVKIGNENNINSYCYDPNQPVPFRNDTGTGRPRPDGSFCTVDADCSGFTPYTLCETTTELTADNYGVIVGCPNVVGGCDYDVTYKGWQQDGLEHFETLTFQFASVSFGAYDGADILTQKVDYDVAKQFVDTANGSEIGPKYNQTEILGIIGLKDFATADPNAAENNRDGNIWYRGDRGLRARHDGVNVDIHTGALPPIDLSIDVPEDGQFVYFSKQPSARTVTAIHCIVDPADTSESVIIDVQECNTTADSCSTVDAALTCTNAGVNGGSIGFPAIAKDNWLRIAITTIVGEVDNLAITIHVTSP